MTRRLDPLDRVKELGDASVPFLFDVHAMIYSDNAPAMENALHNAFNDNRLNLVNTRKEFFNVTLAQIQNEALKISTEVQFIETAEARQYHETLALRKQLEAKRAEVNITEKYPVSI